MADCYAPVFKGASAFVCFLRAIFYTTLLIVILILLAFSLGQSETLLCRFRQISFRMQRCRKGNSDPGINLADPYQQQVHAYRQQYGKSSQWEDWMMQNRNRYENAYNIVRARPATISIAFRYDSTPIAYNPAWTSESEHMTALKTLTEGAYPTYVFNFLFNGDTNASYANAVAGIPTNSSYASGKNMYLYYETIINHEFGHVMGILHHYDTVAEVAQGDHMPPGDSRCIMDRNDSQFCSACRTALNLPLDVDNSAVISAASTNIFSRYPY